MLSRNDQLVPEGEGRRQKARGTCYVDEPPFGFFIAGSSLKELNGVYIRRNIPRNLREAQRVLLFYENCENRSTMLLSEDIVEETEEMRYYGTKAPRSWFLVDQKKVDRFAHVGDTIVPGAGVRWKHVHRQSGSTLGPAAAAAAAVQPTSWYGGAAGGAQLATVAEDDTEELPWQVIAILDTDILQQLIGGARYHKHHCDEAMAGRGGAVRQPALTSLESIVAAGQNGRWIYRVTGEAGCVVRGAPSPAAALVGRRSLGEYVRGVELRDTPSGPWLRLDTSGGDKPGRQAEEEEEEEEDFDEDEEDEEEEEDGVFGGYGGAFARNFYRNLEHAQQQQVEWWVQVEVPSSVAPGAAAMAVLERVDAADCAHLGSTLEGETNDVDVAASSSSSSSSSSASATRRIASLAAEFLDAPFVPRLDGSGGEEGAGAAPSSAEVLVDAGREEAGQIAAASSSRRGALPVGAEVLVQGLSGAESQKFNGTLGVVVSPLGLDGRQSIRLEAPYSGKCINARPGNIRASPLASRAAAEEAAQPTLAGEALARHARLLGLSLRELGLDGGGGSLAAVAEAAAASGSAPPLGFRITGCSPREALDAALRAAQRDALRDDSVLRAARTSHAALGEALAAAAEAGAAPAALPLFSGAPDILVRHGALGAKAAATARAAGSTTSVREAESGIAALKELLLVELERAASAREEEGVDALRLRLTLCLAHLAGGRDAQALSIAEDMIASPPGSPAAHFLKARCLLRLGRREEATAALNLAAGGSSSSSSSGSSSAEGGSGAEGGSSSAGEGSSAAPAPAAAAAPVAQPPAPATPEAAWAFEQATLALRAMRATERRQVRAADAYDRGNFSQAALAFQEALECIEAGARDDKHCRAALHNNIAGCLRRDKRAEEAVAACDAALLLLPRFRRALFRRAVCLLEAGRPSDSVAALETLYRVDRQWPRLSDWLLRAHAAQRRQPAGTGGGSSSSSSSSSPRRAAGSGGGASPTAGGSSGSSAPGADADEVAKLAAEKDHYVVLGVTCDATEKQIKAAYRLRSLKFHPDRAGFDCTAAFQRIAHAFDILSDSDKRATYDQGGDVKGARKGGADDSEDEAEEHKQSLREEIERKYYPERYDFWPFGDPFLHKRRLEATKAKQSGKRQWHEED